MAVEMDQKSSVPTPDVNHPGNSRGSQIVINLARPDLAHMYQQGAQYPQGMDPRLMQQWPQQFPVQYPYPPHALTQEQYVAYNASANHIQKVFRGHKERAEFQRQHRRDNKPARLTGTIKVQVLEAKGLTKVSCMFRMDPIVRITVGKFSHVGEQDRGGHMNPEWKNAKPLFFSLEDNIDHVKIEVENHNTFCNDLVGVCELDINELYENQDQLDKPKWYDIRDKQGQEAGEILVRAQYIPPLFIKVFGARNLKDVQWFGKQDPFVRVRYTGALPVGESGERETKVCQDGHKDPEWDEVFEFHVCNNAHSVIVQPTRELVQPREYRQEDLLCDPSNPLYGVPQGRGQQSKPKEKKEKKETGEVKTEKANDVVIVQIVNRNHLVDDFIAYTVLRTEQLLRTRSSHKPTNFKLRLGKYESGNTKPAGDFFLQMVNSSTGDTDPVPE